MTVNLCGVRDLDFQTKDGDTIKGIKIFFSYQEDGVAGYATDSKFISSSACKELGVSFNALKEYLGQVIDLSVNLKGKITGISSVEG